MVPGELTLDDMLAEPIVKLLMTRDGIDEAELRLLMADRADLHDRSVKARRLVERLSSAVRTPKLADCAPRRV